jgi:hypothetical protein
MSKALDILLNDQGQIFGFFDQVFLFGSSLWTDSPNDIDILLIYEPATSERVNIEKDKVEELLAKVFPDCTVDYTTLSISELQQTNFLAHVVHQKIKG